MTVLYLLLFSYPLWGLALVVLVSGRLAPVGGVVKRMLGSAAVAALCTAIFAPVALGTQGFAFFVPWFAVFVVPESVTVHWQAPIFVATLSFLNALHSGKPRASESAR